MPPTEFQGYLDQYIPFWLILIQDQQQNSQFHVKSYIPSSLANDMISEAVIKEEISNFLWKLEDRVNTKILILRLKETLDCSDELYIKDYYRTRQIVKKEQPDNKPAVVKKPKNIFAKYEEMTSKRPDASKK